MTNDICCESGHEIVTSGGSNEVNVGVKDMGFVICERCHHSSVDHDGGGMCYKRIDGEDGANYICTCGEFTGTAGDRLEVIFKMQRDLSDKVKDRSFFSQSKEEQVEKLCVATIHELVELRDIMNWKWWKNYKDLDFEAWSNAEEELIDVWHFLVQLSIVMGMEPDDILEEYKRKHDVNVKRQESGY